MAAPTKTAPTVKIAITPVSGSVPACQPNLMPFHINYNGPAAVNSFMRVEKLVSNVERPEAHGCEQAQADKSPESISAVFAAETQSLQATTSSDTCDSPLTLTRTTTESTLVTESSFTTLEGSNSSVPPSSSFSRFPTNPQDHAPPIEDLDKRFTSTFRGRSIHGLTINLPDGYAGLVLKATSDRPDGFDEKERVGTGRGRGRGRGDLQRTKDADVDVEMESLGQRRRGRLRSSAAPRKGTVITISDDDNAPQSSMPDEPYGNDVEMAGPLSTLNELDCPLRVLVPTARFDSFTLWQADRLVNNVNDEYWRTLTEWIGLAHEIHSIDV